MNNMKYGPSTAQVEAVIAEIRSWTVGEALIAGDAWGAVHYAAWVAARDAACDAVREAARKAAWDAARYAGRYAAWDAARYAGRVAAWDAAWDAALRDAAWYAAWYAARDAAWVAAWVAAREAVLCALAGDLISEEHQKILNTGVDAVRKFRGEKSERF